MHAVSGGNKGRTRRYVESRENLVPQAGRREFRDKKAASRGKSPECWRCTYLRIRHAALPLFARQDLIVDDDPLEQDGMIQGTP